MKQIHYTIEPKKKSIAKKHKNDEFAFLKQAINAARAIANGHKCSVDIVMNIQ